MNQVSQLGCASFLCPLPPMILMRYFIAVFTALFAATCNAEFTSETQTNTGEVTLNIMNSTSPDNVFTINWPPVENYNPFSEQPVRYEIWHNDSLLDTVSFTRYSIKVSDLSEKIGCISIRAVRGSHYSDHSSPACFFIKG